MTGNKRQFFAKLRQGALATEQAYGVPAEITMAQAVLESNWGKSALGGTNLFGIKGRGSAGSGTYRTKEFLNGRWTTVNAEFAHYGSIAEGIEAHGKLFRGKRYQKAMSQYRKDHDPRAFARNIQGIYATDPTYAKQVISIVDRYEKDFALPKRDYSKTVHQTGVAAVEQMGLVPAPSEPAPAPRKDGPKQEAEGTKTVKTVKVAVSRKKAPETRVTLDANAPRNTATAYEIELGRSISARNSDGSQWRSLWDNHAGYSSVEDALLRR